MNSFSRPLIKTVPATKINMEYKIHEENDFTIITGSIGEFKRSIHIPSPIYDVLANLGPKPIANREVQHLVAEAMGWECKESGGCPRAASQMERVTPGYKAFNGWCALLIGTSEGRNRYFATNTHIYNLREAHMLTRHNAPNSGLRTNNTLKANYALATSGYNSGFDQAAPSTDMSDLM